MRPLRDDDPRDVGPYRVLAGLGDGPAGRVLLAAAPDGGLAAIKLMHRHLAHDLRFRSGFQRAAAAGRQTPPGRWSAPVLAADEHAPEPWIATAFFGGPTLAEAVASGGPFEESALRRLAHGLASALAERHAHSAAHLDLKPSNVILTEDGLRLIDAGFDPAGPGAAAVQLPPEQAGGLQAGPAADLHALAVTVAAAAGADPAAPDTALLPEGLRAILQPCLHPDPLQRPTAADLLLRIGSPLVEPWPPAVASLDARQQLDLAQAARGRGWDLQVRPDGSVAVYGPGLASPPTAPTAMPAAPMGAPSAPTGFPPGYSSPASAYPPPTGQMNAPGFPQPVQAGMAPPGMPMPPKQSNGLVLALSIGAVLVLGIAFVVVLALNNRDDGTPSADGGGSGGGGGGTETTAPADAVETEPDPVADAAVGDCFYDYGDEDEADLEPADYCDPGTFEVVDIYPGTTDLASCEGTDDLSTSVSDSAANLVLCLSYLHANGEAYHAQPGECVYGPNDSVGEWYFYDCVEGAFEVLERLSGESDPSACTESVYYNQNYTFITDQSYLDVVLCLKMIYPDDMGYAVQNDCMSMTGDPDAGTALYHFADCDSANVYVTGRTNTYDDQDFCGNDGWSTWQSYDFPDHAYTVCWNWL